LWGKFGIILDMPERVSLIHEEDFVLPKEVFKKASLGEVMNSSKERRRISKGVKSLEDSGILDPNSELTDDERFIKEQAVFKELVDGDYKDNNVKGLLVAKDDMGLTEKQNENAERNLNRVSATIYFYLEGSDNPKMREALVAGSESVKKITKGTVFEEIEDHVVNRKIDHLEIRAILEDVDYYKGTWDITRELDRQMLSTKSLDGVRRIMNLKPGEEEKRDVLKLKKFARQSKWAKNYLLSYKREVDRWMGREDELGSDQIIDFVEKGVFNNGVLRFTDEMKANPQLARAYEIFWGSGREGATTILMKYITKGQYESVEQMDEVLMKNPMLDSEQKREIINYKRLLAGYVYEGMVGVNNEILNSAFGDLSVLEIRKNLPVALKGLERDVISNVVSEPFLRKQLNIILGMDKQGLFSNASMVWSSTSDKESLLEEVNRVLKTINDSPDVAPENNEVFASEADRLRTFLLKKSSWLEGAIQIHRKALRESEGGEEVKLRSVEMIKEGGIIPKAYEDQYNLVRYYLDYIRGKVSLPGSLDIMHQETFLYEMQHSGDLDPFLFNMINAERGLQYTYCKVGGAGLIMLEKGRSVDAAVEDAAGVDLLIGQDALRYLISKEGAEKHRLKSIEFWNKIEMDGKFHDSYYQTLKRLMGVTEDCKRNKDGKPVDKDGIVITKKEDFHFDSRGRVVKNSGGLYYGEKYDKTGERNNRLPQSDEFVFEEKNKYGQVCRFYKDDPNTIDMARRFFGNFKDKPVIKNFLEIVPEAPKAPKAPNGVTETEWETEWKTKWKTKWKGMSSEERWVSLRSGFIRNFFEVQVPKSRLHGEKGKYWMCWNYYTDAMKTRKEIVEGFWKEEIREKLKMDGVGVEAETEARIKAEAEARAASGNIENIEEIKAEAEVRAKAKETMDYQLQVGSELAKWLQVATAQNAVANVAMIGHPDLTKWNMAEADFVYEDGKDKSAGYIRGVFASWCTTWLGRLVGEGPFDMASPFVPLPAEKLNLRKLDQEKLDFYSTAIVLWRKKVGLVREHFMTDVYQEKDVTNIEYWTKLTDPIAQTVQFGQEVFMKFRDRKNEGGGYWDTVKTDGSTYKENIYLTHKKAVENVVKSAFLPNSSLTLASLVAMGDVVTNKNVMSTYTEWDDEVGSWVDRHEVHPFMEVGDWRNLIEDNFVKDKLSEVRRKKFNIQSLQELEKMFSFKFS
jgi:hypothetical protein